MKEQIIALLSKKETMSLDINSIAKKLEIKNTSVLQQELNELVSKGILDYSPKKNKYLLFENSHLIKARLYIDKTGNGIFKLNDKTITVDRKYLKGATYNDLVAISLDETNNYGKVSRIIERDNNDYIGEVITKKDKLYIKSKKLGLINLEENNSFIEGQKVLLHHEQGRVEIKEVIGHKDDPGMDIKTILLEHGFNLEYTTDVLTELKNIPTILTEKEVQQELSLGRKDYRDELVVTIDCDDTKDIDDGISIKQLPNGNIELKVFIADVDHYVKEGSAIDEQAHTQGTSVYPPGSVLPMLDHILSNGICSLNPNQDRLAMCYTTTFDSKGKVIDFNVEEAIINSKKKMKYSEVNQILEKGIMIEGYEDYLKSLYIMEKLALLIHDNLLQNGYLNFLSSESEVILDEEGNPLDVRKRPTGTSQKIIEYFMITTNIEVAKFAYYLALPHIYRVHGEPSQDRLYTTYQILKANKYLSMKDKKNFTTKDIQKTIDILKELENGEIFSRMLITAQDKAQYSSENIGHYALGAYLYSHNTSPIRRRPDLINQRIIKSFLHNGLEYTQNKYGDLSEIAIHCSSKERDAESAEREATDMKKAEYMEKHTGETYTGYISYVARFGIWVTLENGVEGFIHVNNLPKDKYNYSTELLSLIGKTNRFNIGDKLEIKVKGANKEAKTVDFVVSKEFLKDEQKENQKTKKRVKNN